MSLKRVLASYRNQKYLDSFGGCLFRVLTFKVYLYFFLLQYNFEKNNESYKARQTMKTFFFSVSCSIFIALSLWMLFTPTHY